MYDTGDGNLHRKNIAESVDTFTKLIRKSALHDSDWQDPQKLWKDKIPETAQLVVSYRYYPDLEKKWYCGYYFVCHEDCSIRWLDEFKLGKYLAAIRGVQSLSRALIRAFTCISYL